MTQPIPVLGERFGRWTVIGESAMRNGHRAVLCRCACGTERSVLVQGLRRSDRANPSCGCWRRERTATIVSETRWRDSHGRAAGGKDPLYRLWARINKRCHNPRAHNYRWYGGRGIKVWEGWRHDAGAFIEYVEQNLGPRPSPRHSINRIDNDGDYAPGNIEWATPKQQAANRRPRFA